LNGDIDEKQTLVKLYSYECLPWSW